MRRLPVLEAWLSSLIQTYQDARRRPRRIFGNLSHLEQPTQIYAISVKRGAAHFAIWVVTHEPSVANATLAAVELSDVAELADFSENADEVLGTASIERESHPAFDHLIFRETGAAAAACLQLVDLFRIEPTNSRIAPGITSHGQLLLSAKNPGAYWRIIWKGQLPSTRDFLAMISEPRRTVKTPRLAATPSSDVPVSESPKLQIYGAFHEPPIWFGTPVYKTLRQEILKHFVLPSDSRSPVATGVVGDVLVRFSNDGQLVAFTSDRTLAVKTINQVYAVLSRSGVPSVAVSASELLSINGFNLFTGAITGSQHAVTPRNERDSLFQPSVPQTSYCVPIESAKDAVEVANICANDERRGVLSLRMYDSMTLLLRESFSEAFVVAWSIIEAVVQEDFEAFWSSSGRSRKTIEEMDWSASQQIDFSLAIGRMGKGDADQLHKLRKVRNKVVHRLREATQAEAQLCVASAAAQAKLPDLGKLPVRLVI